VANVNPAVARPRAAGVAAARAAGAPVVVSDVPLLFEAGLAHEFDMIVVVDAPEAARLERLVGTRGLSRDEARARIAAQGDAAAKRARADLVIDNAGPPGALDAQVDALWRTLSARAGT
jgi:dephospho-CoA kinase